ncbi:hypothetical protein PHISCL_02725 [Aspergillus sclerotialis]|uniref:Uncharacterized protein n=1 Tax=Aspergillus sclerotialis TaxID=2070753 RepID=A0A3A3A6H6_9EURO|nr:hypothetical protein PHISCL_02725 [Aspergillus sclerotialis]
MSSWAGWESGNKIDNKGKEQYSKGSHSMGDFGAYNTDISIQNLSLGFAGIPSNLPRTPSPLARTDSAGCYLCEHEDIPIQPHDSPTGLLHPSTSYGRISGDIEIISPNSSLKLGKPEPGNPTSSEFTPSHQNGSVHQPQHAKFKKAIDAMIKAQSDISAKRMNVRELRQKMKHKRNEEGVSRALLMKKLNALSAQIEMSSLSSEFEQLQSVTNEYLDVEMNYNQVEDELMVEEYALFQMMTKLSELLQQNVAPSVMEDTQLSDFESDDTSSTISSLQRVPPSVVAYLSRAGDMRLLQERLAELDTEWLSIVDKQGVRQKMGISMDEESLEFLRDYDEERRQIQDELNDVFREVKRLRAVCDSEGVVMDQYAKGIEAVHENYLDENIHQPIDPLETSATDDNQPFFEVGPGQLNRTTFINKWILHQLRHSRVEITRLKSLPELQGLADKGWDATNISRLALTMWFTDDAAVLSPPSTPTVGYFSENDVEPAKWARQKLDNPLERSRPTIRKCNSDRYLRSHPPRRFRSLSV